MDWFNEWADRGHQRHIELLKQFFAHTWGADINSVKVEWQGEDQLWVINEEINIFDRPEVIRNEEVSYDGDGTLLLMKFSEPATSALGYYLFAANTSDINELIVHAAANNMKG